MKALFNNFNDLFWIDIKKINKLWCGAVYYYR